MEVRRQLWIFFLSTGSQELNSGFQACAPKKYLLFNKPSYQLGTILVCDVFQMKIFICQLLYHFSFHTKQLPNVMCICSTSTLGVRLWENSVCGQEFKTSLGNMGKTSSRIIHCFYIYFLCTWIYQCASTQLCRCQRIACQVVSLPPHGSWESWWESLHAEPSQWLLTFFLLHFILCVYMCGHTNVP